MSYIDPGWSYQDGKPFDPGMIREQIDGLNLRAFGLFGPGSLINDIFVRSRFLLDLQSGNLVFEATDLEGLE